MENQCERSGCGAAREDSADNLFAAQLEEPLVREAYHRVKNSLQLLGSLLHMQSSQVDSDQARVQLESASRRVIAIASVYDMMSRDTDQKIRMPDCLARLCDSFGMEKERERGISLTLAAEELYLDADRALPLCLLASELITNSLKHAFVGRETGLIKVEMRRYGAGMLRLRVEDDGIGCTPSEPEGIGSRLLRVLSTQVHGHLVQKTGLGEGCTVSVYVHERI
jgi:two-component sensor histidine kinase